MKKDTSRRIPPKVSATDELEYLALTRGAVDLTDVRFTNLVAIAPVGRDIQRHIMWLCYCDCGSEVLVCSANLTRKQVRSCGCKIPNKPKRNPLRNTWNGMISRCTNPKNSGYKNYGERGITVCKEWLNSFDAFYDHVRQLEHYKEKGYSLDRINNDLGYFPGNIRWATRNQQSRNKSINRIITFNGESKCLTEWAEQIGIHTTTLHLRLKHGWTIERALTTKLKIHIRKSPHNTKRVEE